MTEFNSHNLEVEIENYFDQLWPICRSIMGPGYRQSLKILSELVPYEKHIFKTGENVFDWTIPQEWVPHEAYLIDPNGKKRANFKENNLHLINYSEPFSGKLPLNQLKEHLYSLPEQPEAIPYLTSYYKKYWGFCLTDKELQTLPDGDYTINVNTEFKDGDLVVGEAILPGNSKKEVLFSSYLCHPSLANNELSGPLVLSFLYQQISRWPQRNLTYRFAIMPETIGAISYLSMRGSELKENMLAGYQITCVGDPGKFTYKESVIEGSLSDKMAKLVLRDHGEHKIVPFNPYEGSDERQYSSPGFELPVGSLMRTPYLDYPQYHTSLDNKEFISFNALAESVSIYENLAWALDNNKTWKNKVAFGEPQLGKRGLYSMLGGLTTVDDSGRAMLWLLNQANGKRDLLSISERSKVKINSLIKISEILKKSDLIEEI